MKKQFFTGIVIILFATLCSTSGLYSQEIDFPAYKNFKIEYNYPVYNPDDLWDYINGAADSYLSYGFSELYIAEYVKGKKITVKVEVYNHLNPVMAFGIYSLERAPSYNFISIGAQGYQEEDHINFFKGNYYVKVLTHSRSKKAYQAVSDIAHSVDASLPGSSSMPSTLELFPANGRLQNEEMFISESVLGHEFLRNAFKSNYNSRGKSFSIYIFKQGDEDTNQKMVAAYLAKLGLSPTDSADGKFLFEDGYNGNIYLAWKNEMTVIISGLKKEDGDLAGEYINLIIN